MEDEDYAFALQLSEYAESNKKFSDDHITEAKEPSSVIDESWELLDPVPDIRQLFMEFDKAYFDGKLQCVEVKWSARMTLCAGLCRYEGHGGLCCINLSQPLLKLRPRSDLVNTLLHEMIHALLFVTNNNKDHNAHGDEFHKHMYRINKQSGSKITVFHSFHDEVNEYRQHWWKCDGPCAKRRPFFGIVRRAMNRVPGPNDRWWSDHQKTCGGVFKKIKEPDKTSVKKTQKDKPKEKDNPMDSKTNKGKSMKSNSKNILDFLSKSSSDTSSKTNLNDEKPVNSGKEILKTSSFWSGATLQSKISSFQKIREKEDSGDSNVFSGSSMSASSNIHGFKMTAIKSNEGSTSKVTSSFSGKGKRLCSPSGKGSNSKSTKTSSFNGRESFLRTLENDILRNKGIKRNWEEPDINPDETSQSDARIEKYTKNCDCGKSDKKRGCECYGDNSQVQSIDASSAHNSHKTWVKVKSSNSEVICIDDDSADDSADDKADDNADDDDDILSAIDEILLNGSVADPSSSKDNADGNLVNCPACSAKVPKRELNDHLDTCLVLG